MKKSIQLFAGLILLIASNTSINAQQHNEVTVDLSNYVISDKVVVHSTYSAFANQVVLSLLDTTHLNAITLDGNLRAVGDSTGYEFPSKGYSITNTIVGNSTLNYLVTKGQGNLSFLQLNRKNKTWTQSSNLIKDGENFLFAVPYKSKFYLFNYERKTGLIHSYTATTNGTTLFKSFDLSAFKMGENDLAFFLKKKKKAIKVITSDSPNELFAARKSKKAYQFKEHVYLTIEDSVTKNIGLIDFNLNAKSHNINYLKLVAEQCDKTLFNKVALSEHYAVTLSGCVAGGSITYWDLQTAQKIKTQDLSKDALIDFKNYDNLISPKQALSIEKLKPEVLLRKFSTGNGSLFLAEKDYGLELTVGHTLLKEKKNRVKSNNAKKGAGTGGGNGSGGGNRKKLDRMKKLKPKGAELTKSFMNYEKTRPQYFIATFNLKKEAFDVKRAYNNPFEGIKALKKQHAIVQFTPEFVFSKKQKFWYGHYDKDLKAFQLLKVE